ncbi:MAG: hypothetical protein LBJ69_03965 [Holosporales bacterium]|nr:hypothetical protein [Holosporales bacterium]
MKKSTVYTVTALAAVLITGAIKLYTDRSVKLLERRVMSILSRVLSDKEIFDEIYKNHSSWGSSEHSSGYGSVKKYAIPYLEYLQKFIDTMKPDSILDFGCGNWELMQHIVIPSHIQYLGVDVVDSVIQDNKDKYERDNIRFEAIEGTDDIKQHNGGLLIVKDVFECWDNNRIKYFLSNIIQNFKHVIFADYFDPSGARNNSANAVAGPAREIDLEAPPFNLKCQDSKVYEINFNEKGQKWKMHKKITLWINPSYKDEAKPGITQDGPLP